MSNAMAFQKQRRRRRGDGAAFRRILTVATAGLSFFVVLYIIAVTVVLPRLRITRVVVQADFEMDRDALLELAGLDDGAHYFAVNETEIARRIEGYPSIRSVEVTKGFPNVVTLRMDRRRPLVASFIEGRHETGIVLIDESGAIFADGAAGEGYDVPVISGITFQGRVVGSSLPESVQPVLESLYGLRRSSPQLYSLISEVRLESLRAGVFDVLLYMGSYRVPVRMNESFDGKTCTYALMVLDVLSQQGIAGDVQEIDFRSGEIVYRMKEGLNAGE